jgi:hypothetical protein
LNLKREQAWVTSGSGGPSIHEHVEQTSRRTNANASPAARLTGTQPGGGSEEGEYTHVYVI